MFLPNECPGLCWHWPGHSLGKIIKLHEMKKRKKLHGFSLYTKYSKFWSVSLENFVARKPLISEECRLDLPILFLRHYWKVYYSPPKFLRQIINRNEIHWSMVFIVLLKCFTRNIFGELYLCVYSSLGYFLFYVLERWFGPIHSF